MYRMMYDCDEHEDWCTKKFPYDIDGFVKKDDFIKYCDWHRHIIQPGTSNFSLKPTTHLSLPETFISHSNLTCTLCVYRHRCIHTM